MTKTNNHEPIVSEGCETFQLEVELQANGIIRLLNGRLIARLCCKEDGYDFEGIKQVLLDEIFGTSIEPKD